ncbi:MAG: UDP-N-acetylmuramoyl-tripeptide--D-alanyl-D-alanine ligase [Pseudomonadota bacterium]
MTAPLWSTAELAAVLGDQTASTGDPVTGVAIDSRLVEVGDLFFALPGDPGPRFTVTTRSDRDGHDFAAAALAAGAAAVVVARVLPDLPRERQWVVSDTLDALWALAAARRAELTGPVVAVTGSSGKTTAKSFLAAATGWAASAGSLNNHIGVPLSLARTPRSAPGAVFEIGMNHPGEIAPLSTLVRPDLAVVLNVQNAHAEAFSDPDGIRREKLSIAQGLAPGGRLVLHDKVDPAGLPAGLRILRFGKTASSAVQLLESLGDQAQFRVQQSTLTAVVPGGGEHRALTLAAVLTVLDALAVPLGAALTLPASLVPQGRGNRRLAGGVEVVDDSYNANPGSMLATLTALGAEPVLAGARRFALLGEMLELGADSAAAHRALLPALEPFDGVWLVGEAMTELAGLLPGHR